MTSPAFSSSGPFQFAAPSSFDGKKENFEEFSFKLRAYLNLMNTRYQEALKGIDGNLDQEITDDHFKLPNGTIDTTLVQMAHNLQYILVSTCSGAANTFLRRDDTLNGFESWRKLNVRYQLPTRAKAVGRLSAILKPKFNMQSFEDSLASWEEEIQKYEKETTSALSGDVKIAVLMNETSGKLQEHLRLNATNLKQYSEVRDVIINYYKSQDTFKKDRCNGRWRCLQRKEQRKRQRKRKRKGFRKITFMVFTFLGPFIIMEFITMELGRLWKPRLQQRKRKRKGQRQGQRQR